MLSTYTFNTTYRPSAIPARHTPSLRLLEGGRFTPGQYAPALVSEYEQTRLKFFSWGLKPAWGQPLRASQSIHLAPARHLFEHPAFRQAAIRQRCLIPADAYYVEEAAALGHRRISKLARRDGETFCLAGIYDTVRQSDGSLAYAFAIVTVPALDKLRPFGLQMPLVLSPAQEAAWLAPDSAHVTIDQLLAHPANHMLHIFPVEELHIHQDTIEQVAA
ncbi:MAG: SOS response-associated peptidase [Bacteroidia bacterium]